MKENNQNTYVFFYVGDDISQPKMLAESIFIADPTAEIIHCSDESTPVVEFATQRFNFKSDRQRLMSSRLEAFAGLGLKEPAIYVDTDMLCMRPINASELTKNCTVRFCERQFNLDWEFNGNFAGMDFTEYHKTPIGVVYPYVACATATTSYTIWEKLSHILMTLDPKFQIWYGDQEAIRKFCEQSPLEVGAGLDEREFGCLPERKDLLGQATLVHFKGHGRKKMMREFYERGISRLSP